ncbi:MAG: hypothetical protein HY923_05305 [Elusimicrobia bacterium]|nr:hypothetical protein [Elusimicrobiota bacterium]
MRPLVLAVLLAAPAAAQQHPQLSQCLGNEPKVRRWFHALNDEQRKAFQLLYNEFAENVRRRKDDGWSNGWLGNFWTHYVNDTNAHGSLGGWVKQAKTWSDSRWKLEHVAVPEAQKDLARAEAALAAAPNSAQLGRDEAAAKQNLADLQELASRQFGACSDWALDTCDTLKTVAQDQFELTTFTITLTSWLGDSGAHMITKACPKAGGECIVLDAWKRGLPELVTMDEAVKGPAKALSCFRPPGD